MTMMKERGIDMPGEFIIGYYGGSDTPANKTKKRSDFDECSASGKSCEYVVEHGDDNAPCAQCRYCGKSQPESVGG